MFRADEHKIEHRCFHVLSKSYIIANKNWTILLRLNPVYQCETIEQYGQHMYNIVQYCLNHELQVDNFCHVISFSLKFYKLSSQKRPAISNSVTQFLATLLLRTLLNCPIKCRIFLPSDLFMYFMTMLTPVD